MYIGKEININAKHYFYINSQVMRTVIENLQLIAGSIVGLIATLKSDKLKIEYPERYNTKKKIKYYFKHASAYHIIFLFGTFITLVSTIIIKQLDDKEKRELLAEQNKLKHQNDSSQRKIIQLQSKMNSILLSHDRKVSFMNDTLSHIAILTTENNIKQSELYTSYTQQLDDWGLEIRDSMVVRSHKYPLISVSEQRVINPYIEPFEDGKIFTCIEIKNFGNDNAEIINSTYAYLSTYENIESFKIEEVNNGTHLYSKVVSINNGFIFKCPIDSIKFNNVLPYGIMIFFLDIKYRGYVDTSIKHFSKSYFYNAKKKQFDVIYEDGDNLILETLKQNQMID